MQQHIGKTFDAALSLLPCQHRWLELIKPHANMGEMQRHLIIIICLLRRMLYLKNMKELFFVFVIHHLPNHYMFTPK